MILVCAAQRAAASSSDAAVASSPAAATKQRNIFRLDACWRSTPPFVLQYFTTTFRLVTLIWASPDQKLAKEKRYRKCPHVTITGRWAPSRHNTRLQTNRFSVQLQNCLLATCAHDHCDEAQRTNQVEPTKKSRRGSARSAPPN